MPKKAASLPSLPKEKIALLCDATEAAAVEGLLSGENLELIPHDFDQLCGSLKNGVVAIALVGLELLTPDRLKQIQQAMSEQEDWSEMPILLFAEREALDDADEMLAFPWLRIVERPLHRPVLMSAIRSAFRLHWSQRQGRALSREILAVEEHHRRVTDSLEASRTRQIADLESLSRRLRQEIEERKRTEEALRESEQLYRYTVELSQQIVWTLTPDDPPVPSGDRFSRVTGTPSGANMEEVLRDAIHPDDRDRTLSHWERAVTAGVPCVQEFRMRVADGSYRMFTSRAVPRLDETGKIVRWYGFIEDITEQKEAMEALRQAEERYRLAARATNDAIWDWNLSTDGLAWSDAAAAYLGNLPLDDSTIQWWEGAIHPDDRPRVVRSIRNAIKSDKNRWSAAYRLRKADGDYAYVYDRGFIIRDENGQALRAVGAVVDLTERRRAEAELRRTQAELIHVSRVSAMGTMASTLAHELNQPLTAVTSYVRGSRRLLSSSTDPTIQQVCEALEFAEAGALRAGQIVRRLRELVARGSVSVEPEDLVKLVGDASVLAFVDEHLHGIDHEIAIDPDARWVDVDRIQIQQVLINLIRNAIQALQNSEKRHVIISAQVVGEHMVEVSVRDTGHGIPESVREALFSPFHSTKAEGMGIGLSISRTIVEAHHGKIWAEDGPDGGAVFRFTLPRAEVPGEELPDVSENRGEQREPI